jgi:hypothetical protein
MVLIEIVCPRCERHGDVAAARLSGILMCFACGFAELIRDGVRKIRAHDDDGIVDTARPKLKRGPWKREITPRVQRCLEALGYWIGCGEGAISDPECVSPCNFSVSHPAS